MGERRQPQLSIPIYYAFPQIKSKLRIKSLLKFGVPLTFKALVKTVNCHLLNDADTKQSKKTGILPEVLLWSSQIMYGDREGTQEVMTSNN